jgi:hypothetical protein
MPAIEAIILLCEVLIESRRQFTILDPHQGALIFIREINAYHHKPEGADNNGQVNRVIGQLVILEKLIANGQYHKNEGRKRG